MKKIYIYCRKIICTFILLFVCTMLYSCDFGSEGLIKGIKHELTIKGSMKTAELLFTQNYPGILTEDEALSHEISYYQKPQILVRQKNQDLTGRDVIHICNILFEKDRKENGEYNINAFCIARIKNYAIKHPDKICGADYYFEGTFTMWTNDSNKYKTVDGHIYCMNGEYIFVKDTLIHPAPIWNFSYIVLDKDNLKK